MCEKTMKGSWDKKSGERRRKIVDAVNGTVRLKRSLRVRMYVRQMVLTTPACLFYYWNPGVNDIVDKGRSTAVFLLENIHT